MDHQGGYDDCITAYGADTSRCKLLEYFNIPSAVSAPVSFFDGGLYDLSSQVYNLSDANGSFSQDGYIRLLSDGDSITIKQGPYAGFVWAKNHNKSNKTHDQSVYAWDASNGDVQIVNSECNTPFSTCWITGDRTDSDTYVFATRGPIEKILAGTYTVQTTANIPHEKDLSDNSISYSYDAADVGNPQTQTDEGGDTQDPPIPLSDLLIIELPGPGTYSGTIPEGMPGVMYHLQVPEDINFMYLQLFTIQGEGFEIFTRKGSIPVPNFPTYENGEYDRSQVSDTELPGKLPFNYPPSGDYYIFVDPWQGNGTSFQIKLEWNTGITTGTPNADGTQTPTPDPYPGTFTEVEQNDSAVTANFWNISHPFTGQISRWNDQDYVQLNFTEPGIYSYTVSETGQNLKAKLSLVRKIHDNSSLVLDDANSSSAGGEVSLTFDASAGETYYLKVSAIGMPSDVFNQSYKLEQTGFVPDPFESNDDNQNATLWNLANPIEGYFWDQASGSADLYTFTAPSTIANSPVVFTVTNPSSELRIRVNVMRSNGSSISNTSFLAAGQPATFSVTLVPNQQYFLKLEVMTDQTCLQPYQLSASYSTDGGGPVNPMGSHPVRISGRVNRQWSIFKPPLPDVEIYIQINRQPAILLDTTKGFGSYSETLNLSGGQQVRIWAVKEGYFFEPLTDIWEVTATDKSHKSNFIAEEATIHDEDDLSTPTPDSQDATSTPIPTPDSQDATSTPIPTPDSQNATSTPIPSTETITNSLSGVVWRLFSDSDPAGVGAAQLLLTVNGVSQPVVYSMIDGTYSISVSNLHPGDQLSLRAQNPEDVFEPISYDWLAEEGVENYVYDFYSYWGSSGSSEENSQNYLYGKVTDLSGQGLSGINILMRIGDSDALQLLGPTDSNGDFMMTVDLPSRMMVTLWVEQPGFLPSKVQFFHAYATEIRELNFVLSTDSLH